MGDFARLYSEAFQNSPPERRKSHTPYTQSKQHST